MYYAFYGLKLPPFRITPDTEFFFDGANRGAVLEALTYAIISGEGIVKVTGEVGSGKTMLCRVLQQRLAPTVDIVYLANPNVPPEQILHAIAFELQLPVGREASRLEVMHALQAYLVERHAQRRQVVVFVEESQGMPIATLEEIRLLSNLETDRHKLLQLVLFGQPELDENLRQNHIRQLRERITHSFYLSPLSAAEIEDYLRFRLQAAGYRGPDLFSRRVIQFIARASAGLTRRVNIIADKALLAAYAGNTHTVTLAHVRQAVDDSEFSRGQSPRRRRAWLPWAAGIACTAILVSGAAWWLWSANAAPVSGSRLDPTAAITTPAQAGVAEPPSQSQPVPARPTPVSVDPRPPGPEDVDLAGPQRLHISANISAPPTVPTARGDAASATGDAGQTLLERRLAAMPAWLRAQPEDAYTVQLIGASDAKYLKQYLKTLSKSIDTDNVFVYRTRANLKPFMTVVYRTYPSLRSARDAIDQFPSDLQRFRPYERTIRGLRAEVMAGVGAADP